MRQHYVIGLTAQEQRSDHPRTVGEALLGLDYVKVIGDVHQTYVRVEVPESHYQHFRQHLPSYLVVSPYKKLQLL